MLSTTTVDNLLDGEAFIILGMQDSQGTYHVHEKLAIPMVFEGEPLTMNAIRLSDELHLVVPGDTIVIKVGFRSSHIAQEFDFDKEAEPQMEEEE